MSKKLTIKNILESPVGHLNQHLMEVDIPVKKNKYRNKKTEIDGIVFDSEKEANRYKELKVLLKAGKIGMLDLQVPFELNTGGTHSLKYIADFVYIETASGNKIIEDVKGFRTKEYRKKKSLMKKVYNIKIKEV